MYLQLQRERSKIEQLEAVQGCLGNDTLRVHACAIDSAGMTPSECTPALLTALAAAKQAWPPAPGRAGHGNMAKSLDMTADVACCQSGNVYPGLAGSFMHNGCSVSSRSNQ
ncbi:hypothetical protein WJX77_007453 [Trebouxia sp. C0004]